MRFYLDEMFSQVSAQIARGRGIDVASCHERGRDGATDEEQLRFASSEGRCIVTRNFSDFVRIAGEFLARGEPHAGVLLVPHSISADNFATLAAALVHFDQEHPDGLPPYSLCWLAPAPA